MSYSERTGNLFQSGADAIGHGVNMAGLMGAGVAREVRARWPEMYYEYRRRCASGELLLGRYLIWHSARANDPWVANLVTQVDPGPDARLEAVMRSVSDAVEILADEDVKRFALPRIGCGIGGLRWADVRRELMTIGEATAIDLEVWTP